MLPSTLELLRDLLREAEFLDGEVRRTNQRAFLDNEVLKRGLVRGVEVIGEAAKQVPDETRAQCPQIERKEMTGMRDRLIRDYAGVDYRIVWDVAVTHAPALAAHLRPILQGLDNA